MEMNTQQTLRTYTFSNKTGTDIAPNRFLKQTTSGGVAYATAADSVIAISMHASNENAVYEDDKLVSGSIGIVFVECAEPIPIGSKIGSNYEGKAVVCTGSHVELGYAASATSAAGEKVLFVPSFGTATGAVWGAITGTLADQTDLQAELDNTISVYDSAKTYGFNDLVSFSGEVYKSINATNTGNTPSNNSQYWQTQTDNINSKMAMAFANGFNESHEFEIISDGITITAEVWRKDTTWDSEITYDSCKKALLNGKLYSSIQDSNLNKNPETEFDYWRFECFDDGNLHGTIDGSDLIYTLDCTTGTGTDGHAVVTVTAGTDSIPILQQIYCVKVGSTTNLILESGTTLATGCVIFVGYAYLQSAATVITNGAITQQRYTNSFYRPEYGKGIIGAIRERIRVLGIEYFSGCASTVTITNDITRIDDVIVNVNAGNTYQLWPQQFPDFSTGTPTFTVLNDPITPYRRITNFNQLTYDANGVTFPNLANYGIIVVGIQQSGTNTAPRLGVLLPAGYYTTAQDAISDIFRYDTTTVDFALRFTTFPICRVVLDWKTNNNGTYTNLLGGTAVQDRRGFKFGYLGGSGATGYATSFSDGTFEIFNSTDPTKQLNFSNALITTGQTRVLSAPDKNGTIATVSDVTAAVNASIATRTASFATSTGNQYNKCNSATAINATLDAGIPIGATVVFSQANTGEVTFVAGTSVTIEPTGKKLVEGSATAICIATNTYRLDGNLEDV